MEYLNFELRIGIKNGDQYPVSVIDSPVGGTSAMVSFPLNDPQFKSHLKIIESSRGKSKTRKKSQNNLSPIRGGMEFSPDEEITSVKEFGTDLFERLFSDEIKSSFHASLLLADKEEKGLRIKLGIEDADLSSLPWEYLYNKDAGDYLCLSIKTPLVRILELAKPVEILTVQPPLRILGIISSPNNLPTLDVEREKANMNMAIEHLISTGLIELKWLKGQTWRDLDNAMDESWHMLHFIGHGGFDSETEEGTIALANEDGSANHLSSTQLGRMLEGNHSLRLVVLNSCEGAKTSDEDIFSSAGASLIRKGIPAVVSMQYEITDLAALEFSRTFYEKIANGLPIDTALQKARKAITFADKNSVEWATPVLHMRSTDGRLFDIDTSSAIFSETQLKDKPKPIDNLDSDEDPGDYIPLSSNENKGLNILMKKVRNFWINGVLEPSIEHSALMKLGFDNMPDMVDSPWGSSPITEDDSIITVFNEVGRSLLILGEPGAGKTTLLLTLTKELLDQYESKQGLPLPVVFNLSSWTKTAKPILKWLADELSTKYMIPSKFGIDLIQNNRLLPLLDGLDEVGSVSRNLCVKAINSFLEETTVMGVVVCCRFKEYLQLDSKLIVNGALRVRLLTSEKIMNYLDLAGPSFSGLKELLKTDSSFLKLAETPLMLSLMMQTFRDFESDHMTGRQLQSINAKRKQLMAAYVKNQFRMAEDGTNI